MLPILLRPAEYQRARRDQFATLASLRYYLTRRRANGLVESGAVIESPIGLRINPPAFDAWLLGRAPRRSNGAAVSPAESPQAAA